MSIAGFFFIFVAGCYWPSVASYSAEALADQVVTLPGAHSSQKSKQFSGYLDVSATRGIHYMYFESERNPEKDSVVFWTNGGPGCSGLLGLYTEFGPWRAGANTTLIRNPFSWTKYANIVFLEQPVGVGFSYSTTPIASTGYNDYMASKDNLLAVKAFFRRYPERAQNDFYLSSESYGGHYIPQWTLQVLNDPEARVHFKGYLLGNPFTSYGAGSIAMANALWGLQLVPKPLWDTFTDLGCESLYNSAYDLELNTPQCFDIMDALFSYIDDLNPYALEFPTCISASSSGSVSASAHTDLLATDQPVSSAFNKAGTRLGAQARMFLRMHAKLKRTQTYKDYKAGLQRRVQPTTTSASTGAGAGVGPTEVMGMDGVLKRKRSILAPHQYADYTRDGPLGGGKTPLSKTAEQRGVGAEKGSLSEESEFRYDPCAEAYTVEYLNNAAVQEALHVRTIPSTPHLHQHSGQQQDHASNDTYTSTTTTSTITSTGAARRWDFCSDDVNGAWAFNDYLGDTTSLYRAIYHHRHKPPGFKMLVYSGDVDGVCATVGTQHWIYNVTGSAPTSLFKVWHYDDVNYGRQQGGYLTKFPDSFSFMTVRYAGHEVPAYQPQKALELFKRYLDGSLFDTSSSSQ